MLRQLTKCTGSSLRNRLRNRQHQFRFLSTSSEAYHPPQELLKKLPKADLHVHLDGSLRLSTLVELCNEMDSIPLKLPSFPNASNKDWTEEMFIQDVFKPAYGSLDEYLQGFMYTTAVMRTPEQLERICYEFVMDSIDDGVYYVEPRFAPQLFAHSGFSIEEVIQAVDRGLSSARRDYNASRAQMENPPPEFNYGIILCAMRVFNEFYSDYYKSFTKVMPNSKPRRQAGAASLALAQEAVICRDKLGIPVVALDLAGSETGFPAKDHKQAFTLAHQHFLQATVHAGEAYGPESIYSALTDLYARRIGHGYHLFSHDYFPTVEWKESTRRKYVDDMIHYMASTGVCMEVCLTSNIQTMPQLKTIADHNVGQMFGCDMNVAICTDNRLVSDTTSSHELGLIFEHDFGTTKHQLRGLILNGFYSSFYSGSWKEKKAYIASVVDYYNAQHDAFDADKL